MVSKRERKPMTTRLERKQQEVADAERIANDVSASPAARKAARSRLSGLYQALRIAQEQEEYAPPSLSENIHYKAPEDRVSAKVEEQKITQAASQQLKQETAGYVPPV